MNHDVSISWASELRRSSGGHRSQMDRPRPPGSFVIPFCIQFATWAPKCSRPSLITHNDSTQLRALFRSEPPFPPTSHVPLPCWDPARLPSGCLPPRADVPGASPGKTPVARATSLDRPSIAGAARREPGWKPVSLLDLSSPPKERNDQPDNHGKPVSEDSEASRFWWFCRRFWWFCWLETACHSSSFAERLLSFDVSSSKWALQIAFAEHMGSSHFL